MSSTTTEIEGLSPLKRAIVELRQLRARVEELEGARREPIAVIGVGCRFPGADGPDAYWRLLTGGVDAIAEIPPDRFDVDAYYDPDPDAPGKIATRFGGFLEGIDAFDAHFFGITPREAVSMDPQQRLLLEVTWEALEHAAQSPQALAGSRTGVFVGIGTSDYTELRLMTGDPADIDAYLAMGASHSVASGRLSYVLGLEGPSISIDTACSSSLVAVHLAVRSLRSRECRLALAGGVNLILLPELVMTLSRAHMMAPDGRCKTFDARADGFVRAEGCGMVVLKRLADALADGDHVLAVVRGSAVNQDGRTSGLTAPNGLSQQAVLREALEDAGVRPADVAYVEAHGTGTALGDPIEAQALGAVFGAGRPADRPLAVGSVKTNVGHLEAAAGVGGLIKAVLALHHEEIPPHLHLERPSPLIPWEELPLVVPTERTPWPRGETSRVAGVSSFGFSGTNAHVVLEEAPPRGQARGDPERPCHLLALSAKSEPALRELAARLERHLVLDPDLPVADVCFSAGAGRAHFAHRLAVPGVGDAAQLSRALARAAAGDEEGEAIRGTADVAGPLEVAFLFTGQGAHYPGMGRRLLETQPAFRRALERCDELAGPAVGRSLVDVLYGEPDAGSLTDVQLHAQPALFALEYALAEVWRSFGIEPAAVLGHSVGEYVAACIAGVLGLEDALALVTARGRLADALPEKGEMTVVRASEETVAAAVAGLGAGLSVAAVNGPENVVVAGRSGEIAALVERLGAAGVETRRLEVPYASHSPLMEPVLDEFERAAAGLSYSPPAIPLVSCLTGGLAGPDTVTTPAYWRRHLREPVRFAAGIAALAGERPGALLELGPRATLLGMARGCWPEGAPQPLWLPSLRHDRDDWEQVLESLGALYAHGAAVDWAGFDRGYPRRRVPLPTYPFERQSYWLEDARGPVRAPAPGSEALWEAVLSAGAHAAGRGPLELDLALHEARWESLNRLALAAMANALTELGAFAAAGEAASATDLVERLGIEPRHEALLGRWLAALAGEGLLVRGEGDEYLAGELLPAFELAPLAAEAKKLFTDSPALPEYLERCAAALPAVLRGARSPLELLFPEGSSQTAEYLYETSGVPRYANGVARAVLGAVVRVWPDRRQLRVLEAGAGTGGTTASLLPVLWPEATSYCFTDLSEFFFARAEERFAAYPFLRYGVLDLEQDPEVQGFAPGSFDVAVGANVVHATRDLAESLGHLLSLLAPGGLLVLYETTSHPGWFDVSIGLIEGWSRFADGLRTDQPLLPATAWQDALEAAGFEATAAWPEPGSPAEALGVHVIVARAPAAAAASAGATAAAAPGREALAAGAPAEDGQAGALRRELAEALPEERAELLTDYVRRHVNRVTRSEPARAVDRRHRLMDLGVDSLMAVELATRLGRGLALDEPLPSTLVFDYPTIEAIVGYLDREALGAAPPQAGAPAAEDGRPAAREAEVEALSDEEVEALLVQKLEGKS